MFHLFIKLTNECNLRCEYCFEIPNFKKKCISISQVESILRKVASSKDPKFRENLLITLTGGEPLLLGVDFFTRLQSIRHRLFSSRRKKPELSVQTNLILLSKRWIDFFESNPDIHLSVSCDVIGAHRRTKGGKRIDVLLKRKIEMLVKSNISYSAICVITSKNVCDPDKIYNFFSRRGIDFLTVPAFFKAGEPHEKLCVDPKEYGRFLIRMTELWLSEKKPSIIVGNIRHFIQKVKTGSGIFCYNSGNCSKYTMSIEPSGDAYPCTMFFEPEYRLGNIFSQSLGKIMISPRRERFLKRYRRIMKICSDCEFLDLCRGGCPGEAMAFGDEFDKSYFCDSYKMIFDYLTRRIEL